MVPKYMTGSKQWAFSVDHGLDSTVSISDENFDNSVVAELFIDDWFYLERLDDGYWSLTIGDKEFTIFPDHTLHSAGE